ncbi:YtxH domain-containing protein [Algibacter pacificus]|uniref:YtxH domain-containing protein n=1 Tax=Algibacter pacificus TaxID=2599389 RepID=UPI0011CC4F3A|nr:YtxH domain-containing protein [Algibacter pacificus]
MNNNTSNTIFGIFAGAIAGAALGILYAPDKGANTRKKIATGAVEAKDNLVEKASEIKDTVVNSAHSKKVTLDEQVESIVSDVSHKTEDVISTLENKLADLKKQNKKYQKA